MPTFTAIALDRLLEPGAPKPVSKPPNTKLEMRKSSPTAVTNTTEKRIQWPQVSPSLYTTPEATPLPDSPFSFPPSPYIINHKRRGPRLLKSFSQDDVSRNQEGVAENDVKVEQTRKDQDIEAVDSVGEFSFNPSVFSPCEELGMDGFQSGQFGNGGIDDGMDEVNNSSRSLALSVGTGIECDDFFDPNETMSITTSVVEVEECSRADSSLKLSTTTAEYFDACEELYSEGSPQYSLRNIEGELREIRLNLFMEIEKRKQAEEALDSRKREWLRFMEQLSLAGLTVPATAASVSEDENLASDFAEELCQQVHVARVVSTAVGRGLAKAEIEMEMESQVEGKNFEIARLWDRLRYYEAVNHEMSQRNQESIELARHRRQKRKRRQIWVWGSVGAAIALGSAALVWSFLPSHTSNPSHSFERDDAPMP